MPYKKNTIVPKWFNAQQVVDAAKETQAKVASQEPLQKQAATKFIVVSYMDSRGHVINAEDKTVVSQLAKGQAPVDEWGQPLVPHAQIPVFAKPETLGISAVASLKEVDVRERQVHPSYMADSTINRHIQYKALQKLTDFANDMGLYGARARYLHGKNASMEGKQFVGLREVTAEISWLVGPRLKKNIVATIGVDPGDKGIMPKVFKDASGTEHEFTKEAVAQMLKGMQFEKPSREVRKRSDIPTYRKPDPTNFRPIPRS